MRWHWRGSVAVGAAGGVRSRDTAAARRRAAPQRPYARTAARPSARPPRPAIHRPVTPYDRTGRRDGRAGQTRVTEETASCRPGRSAPARRGRARAPPGRCPRTSRRGWRRRGRRPGRRGCAWESGTCWPAYRCACEVRGRATPAWRVRPLGQARAVEARGAVGAPHVRAADGAAGGRDGRGGPRGRRAPRPERPGTRRRRPGAGGAVDASRSSAGSAFSSRRASASLRSTVRLWRATAARLRSSSARSAAASARCWSSLRWARPRSCRPAGLAAR